MRTGTICVPPRGEDLLPEGFSLALGIVLSCGAKVLEILMPMADLREVAGVRVGDLVLDAGTGEEVNLEA